MALNEEQAEWLRVLLDKCEGNPSRITKWEVDFTDQQRHRLEQYGEHMSLSPKQWEVLRRIDEKLDNDF